MSRCRTSRIKSAPICLDEWKDSLRTLAMMKKALRPSDVVARDAEPGDGVVRTADVGNPIERKRPDEDEE